jgi:putative toxin-antitoxin system antitoxin component (TIGR02293 family)
MPLSRAKMDAPQGGKNQRANHFSWSDTSPAAETASLPMPLDQLAPKLGLSKATLHRRKLEGRLTPAESDRVMRYARLVGKAVEVMGNEEAGREWLRSEQYGLGMAVPLEYAETEAGAREVEYLLGRIDYGVYS